MTYCVVKTLYPNGQVKLSSEADHNSAICNLDPFWWIVPGEPEGSLLFCEVEESLPSTLRSPPSSLTLKDSIPDSRVRMM